MQSAAARDGARASQSAGSDSEDCRFLSEVDLQDINGFCADSDRTGLSGLIISKQCLKDDFLVHGYLLASRSRLVHAIYYGTVSIVNNARLIRAIWYSNFSFLNTSREEPPEFTPRPNSTRMLNYGNGSVTEEELSR